MSVGVLTGYAAGGSRPASGGGIAPAQVTGFTATTFSTTRIDLAWDQATAAEGYRVEFSLDGVTFSLLVLLTGIASTSYSATGLTPGTHYWFRVRGTGSVSGAWSVVLNRYTLPGQVTGLTANSISATEIDQAWTALAAAPTNYELFRSRDGVTFANVGQPTATSYQDNNGLLPGTLYTYKVRGVNPGGNGAFSTTATATTGIGSNTLALNLAFAFDLNEATGNGARVDALGNGNMTAAGSPSQVPFRSDGARGFGTHFASASTQYVELANATHHLDFSGDWEFVCWLKPDDASAGGPFYIAGHCDDARTVYSWQLTRTLQILNFVRDGGFSTISTTDNDLRLGWNFVDIWYVSATKTTNIRVNQGTTKSITSATAIGNRAVPFRIGRVGGFYANDSVTRAACWIGRNLADYEREWLFNGFQGRDSADLLVASPTPLSLTGGSVVYSAGPNNSFTDLEFHPGSNAWYLTLRDSLVHGLSTDSKIKVLKCPAASDFNNPASWSVVATILSPSGTLTDIIDAFINLMPDGRLSIHSTIRNPAGTTYDNCVFFSSDGTTWAGASMLTGITANDWLWRTQINPSDSTYYGISYTALLSITVCRLYKSTDAINWTLIVDPLDGPGKCDEGAIWWKAFDNKGVMVIRIEQSHSSDIGGESASPYTSWNVRSVGFSFRESNSKSPILRQLPGGQMVTVGRFTPAAGGQHTSLAWVDAETSNVVEVLNFDGTQTESGYPGFRVRNGMCYFSWYNTANVGGDNPTNKAVVRVGSMPVPN